MATLSPVNTGVHSRSGSHGSPGLFQEAFQKSGKNTTSLPGDDETLIPFDRSLRKIQFVSVPIIQRIRKNSMPEKLGINFLPKEVRENSSVKKVISGIGALVKFIDDKSKSQTSEITSKLKNACDQLDEWLIFQCFCIINPRYYESKNPDYFSVDDFPTHKELKEYLSSICENNADEVIIWLLGACIIDGMDTRNKAGRKSPASASRFLDTLQHQTVCWEVARRDETILTKISRLGNDFLEIYQGDDSSWLLRRVKDGKFHLNSHRFNYHIFCSFFEYPPTQTVILHYPEQFIKIIEFLVTGKIAIDYLNWESFLERATENSIEELKIFIFKTLKYWEVNDQNWLSLFCAAAKHNIIPLVEKVYEWVIENSKGFCVYSYEEYVEKLSCILWNENIVNQTKNTSRRIINLILGMAILYLSKHSLENEQAKLSTQKRAILKMLKADGIKMTAFDVNLMREASVINKSEKGFGDELISIKTFQLLKKYCPKISEAHVNQCPSIDSKAVSYLIEYFPNLQSLSLRGCSFRSLRFMRNLCGLRKLSHLDISLIPLEKRNSFHFENRNHMMTSVNLSYTGLTDSGLISFFKYYASLSLRALRLRGCLKLSEKSLCRIGEYSSLEDLDLSECSVSDNLGHIIAQSLRLLKRLHLSKCAGLVNTLHTVLIHSRKMKDLNLSGCNVNPGTMNSLSKCESLEVLDISNCVSVDDYILASTEELKSLKSVNLSRSKRLTGVGVNEFRVKCMHLSEMVLEECPSVNFDTLVRQWKTEKRKHPTIINEKGKITHISPWKVKGESTYT